MSKSASGKSQRRSDEILAGEYVLGVLSQERMHELDRRLTKDSEFSQTVNRWRRNLKVAAIDEQVAEQVAFEEIYGAPALWADERPGRLMALFAPFAILWRSITFWRTATALLMLYFIVSLMNEIG